MRFPSVGLDTLFGREPHLATKPDRVGVPVPFCYVQGEVWGLLSELSLIKQTRWSWSLEPDS